MSSIIVQRLDGTTYDLDALGFKVKTFDVPSANYQYTYQQVGTYGTVKVDTQIQELVIPMTFDVLASDTYDFELQKLEIARIFASDEEFYIINSRIPYLRWRVAAEQFTMPQMASFWRAQNATVSFDCPSGYAESIATTLNPFTDEGNWGLGMNISNDIGVPYSFKNTNSMKIYNASTIPLMADNRPVTIKFNGVVSKKLSIKNKTTNQDLEVNTSLKKTDNLINKGLVTVKNNASIYANTNHAFLDFKRGWNDIEISGATDFTISFETRFYY